MNTTVYELQQYYVAMGGEAADVADITTIPDMIAAITAISGGGSGKSGGGSDSMFVINAKFDSSNNFISQDKSFDEIVDQVKDGVFCYAFVTQDYSETAHSFYVIPLTNLYLVDDSPNGSNVSGGMSIYDALGSPKSRNNISIKFLPNDTAFLSNKYENMNS